jgi:hypothetical protein
MAKYKLLEYNGQTVAILQQEDTPKNILISIPLDKENTQYQEYLEWVAEGNTPEAAD